MAQQNSSINDSDYKVSERYIQMVHEFLRKHDFAESVFIWILSVIEIPIIILTMYALCFLIKSHRTASLFVIHLILSDLIQLICILITTINWSHNLQVTYYYCLIVGLYFMVCIAFERYLLVSHPHWYKSHHSLKLSCIMSVVVWFVPLIFAEISPPTLYFFHPYRSIACLIPYPIIILCFIGTCRGLSHSISLTALKRKLILGSLFLVLLTYTFLIIPFVIHEFISDIIYQNTPFLEYKIDSFLKYLMYLNPLADCLLYLFMRADVDDIMKSFVCCCSRHKNQNPSSMSTIVNSQKHSHS